MEAFEWEGKWWIAEQKENIVSGILRHDPSGKIELDLTGSFFESSDPERTKEIPLIHGVTKESARLVTLYECDAGRMSLSMPGFFSTTYSPKFILVGHLFDNPAEISFNEVRLSYKFLEEWLNRPFFDMAEIWRRGEDPRKHTFTYRMPEFPCWHVEDFTVTLDSEGGTRGSVLRELTIYSAYFFKVTTEKSFTLDDIVQRLDFSLRNFLSLALGYPVLRTKIVGRSPTATEEISGKIHYENIEILTRNWPVVEEPDRLLRDDMLFSFADVEGQFEALISKWFELVHELAPVLSLYFYVLNSPRVFEINHFLNLARAVESFHRRVFGGHYEDHWKESEHFKHFLNCIPPDLDPAFKEKLKNTFVYLNEFSLKKRLIDLVSQVSNIVALFIPDAGIFANDVANTRNYLTHYDEDLRERARKDFDLYLLSRQLQHLLETCFMIHIGIPEETVANLVRRNQRIRVVAQHINKQA